MVYGARLESECVLAGTGGSNPPVSSRTIVGVTVCQVYYEAKKRALENGGNFHLAAYANTGEIGTNGNRKTAKFRRRYSKCGYFCYEVHAEVDLIIRCRQVPQKINVMRFTNSGDRTMAKPCVHCQNFLRHVGVKRVRFTNWEGRWEEMKL